MNGIFLLLNSQLPYRKNADGTILVQHMLHKRLTFQKCCKALCNSPVVRQTGAKITSARMHWKGEQFMLQKLNSVPSSKRQSRAHGKWKGVQQRENGGNMVGIVAAVCAKSYLLPGPHLLTRGNMDLHQVQIVVSLGFMSPSMECQYIIPMMGFFSCSEQDNTLEGGYDHVPSHHPC